MAILIRILFFVSMICSVASAKLTFRETRTASDNIIVSFFTNDTFDIHESDDIGDLSKWMINGQPARQISRYVTPAHKADHHIYLRTSKLIDGENYLIETPQGCKQTQFNQRDICESIKINQAGIVLFPKLITFEVMTHDTFYTVLANGSKLNGKIPLPQIQTKAALRGAASSNFLHQ